MIPKSNSLFNRITIINGGNYGKNMNVPVGMSMIRLKEILITALNPEPLSKTCLMIGSALNVVLKKNILKKQIETTYKNW